MRLFHVKLGSFIVAIAMVVLACAPPVSVPPPTTKKPPPTTKKPPPTTKKPPPPTTKTVVVVGSGPGAVTAAVSAAGEGASVTLISHDAPVLGGQALAVGRMDVKGDDAQYGPYREFLRRGMLIAPSMGLSSQEIADGKIPPELTKRVLNEWLADYGVRVVRAKMSSVQKTGNRINGVTAAGVSYPARVVVDGTELGDVLAKGNVAYRLGSGRSDRGTIKSGDCLQDMTWPVIASTTSSTKSTGKIIPILRNGNPLVAPVWDTVEPHSRYREVASPGTSRRSMWNHHTADVPVSVWDATSGRDAVFQRAAMKTMDYAASLQNMSDGAQWGLDVGSTANSWPLTRISVGNESAMTALPYVREGRRMVGITTLTSRDMKRVAVPGRAGYRDATQDADAIAIGNYASDLHGCHGANDPEEPVISDIQDGVSAPHQWGPFSVPSGILIPESVEGLVAAEKNLSSTRAANAALRLQPIAFSTGAAAGVTAGLAAYRHIDARLVPALDVQWRIAHKWGADLSIQPWTDARPTTKEQAFVEVATARGWMSGVAADKAGHESTIPRMYAISLLAQAKGLRPASRNVYVDTPDAWGRWLTAAHEDGWFSGCGQSKACPDRKMTRMEAAYVGTAVLGDRSGGRGLPSDVSGAGALPAASAVASGYMGWCGASSQFCPTSQVTRTTVTRIGADLIAARTR